MQDSAGGLVNEDQERFRIRELLDCYFNSVDAKDVDAVAGCFSEDATAIYQSGTPFETRTHGGRNLAEELIERTQKYKSSNHASSNVVVRLAGSEADTTTFAVAYLYVGDFVSVRGIRYDDHLAKQAGRWAIVTRTHRPLWQYQMPASPLVPAGRI